MGIFLFLFLFFTMFPLWKPRWWFYWQNPQKNTGSFPVWIHCLRRLRPSVTESDTHSQHTIQNLPVLQKILTCCGVGGEHSDPQLSCLCQENFCFSILWERLEAVGDDQIWKGWNKHSIKNSCFVDLLYTFTVRLNVSIISGRNVGIHA